MPKRTARSKRVVLDKLGFSAGFCAGIPALIQSLSLMSPAQEESVSPMAYVMVTLIIVNNTISKSYPKPFVNGSSKNNRIKDFENSRRAFSPARSAETARAAGSKSH